MPDISFKKLFVETGKTIRIGAPIVAAQLLQMSMGFTDTLMAGNLSSDDLAAVAVGGSLLGPILLFCMGIMMGVSPIVAHLNGAGKQEEIGRNVWSAFWLSQLLAWPAFFLLRNMQFVMYRFDINPGLIPVAQGYLDAFAWGYPAMFAYFGLRFFHEGLAVTKPAMYFSMIGLLTNVLGNWVFMFGKFGFPALGAVGTGWASALVNWVMLGCMVSFTFRKRIDRQYNIRQNFHLPNPRYQKELVAIGLPNGTSICIEVMMFAVVALLMGSIGVKTVAAHQVTINFAALTFMIPLGLSFAATARVGFAAGKGDMRQARLAGLIGLGLSVLVMSITAVIMINWPDVIAGMYSNDDDVVALAAKLLFYAGVFQISDGMQVGGFGALRGLKDTRIPLVVNVISYWGVGLPSGYLLGMKMGYGAEGLWMGLIAGLSVAAILHNLRFHLLSRPHNQLKTDVAMPGIVSHGE